MEKLDQHFCETVEKLLTHDTRIIYRSGWLSWQFRCDYEIQGRWKKISYNSTLKVAAGKCRSWRGKVGSTGRLPLFQTLKRMPTQIKFGTDGWRGLIADDFTFDNVRRVAGAIAGYVLKHEDPTRA